MTQTLTLDIIKQAVSGHAAAFRCVTEYQPMGGLGDKVFPPTYEGGRYATEDRVDPKTGEVINCVLLNSVQSEANFMELGLLEAWRSKRIHLPIISTEFKFDDPKFRSFKVTSLEAPHRVADAAFRDSHLNGVIFRKTEQGRVLDHAETRNATGLFGICPTALIFGVWDSSGPRGGLGTKFQRSLVSEMIGFHAVIGSKTSSRIDALGITTAAGPLYERSNVSDNQPEWTIHIAEAKLDSKNQPIPYNKGGDSGKPGNPSKANHSNVVPTIKDGGFTIKYANQTTVLSLVALRRLRFPLKGTVESDNQVDIAARTVLTTLGLLAAVLHREQGADLRSRCQLFPQQAFVWELLDVPTEEPKQYMLNGDTGVELFNQAVKEAIALGLPWEDEIKLQPSEDLLALVRKSQEANMHQSAEGGE